MKDVLGTHTEQMVQFSQKEKEHINYAEATETIIKNLRKEISELNFKLLSYKENISNENLPMTELKELSKQFTSGILKNDSGKLFDLEKSNKTFNEEIKNLKQEISYLKTEIKEHFTSLSTKIEQCIDHPKNIDELEKEILKYNSDSIIQSKRLQGLEELIVMQRKELFNNISEIEAYVISKMDPLNRNLTGIAQQIGYKLNNLN